ncbi:hypothetical protein [Mameliella alba]|uniref:hypothetical protein n=1 Tax=Mameliella alba TaxID=561184 RepID=UPI000B52E3F1|nr:hypothetical protein [Mameliella alba]MBY6117782.1 hypothetical protein [Mameliella alba]OWV44439.1 hypothetical protein CDZ95_07085 [Mameliella alba]OWV65151.1 hypothetical protein CDZ97_09870 [Mameliella alba]
MSRFTLFILGVALACAAAAGPEAWAKLIWRAGFPQLAVPLIQDPAARAAALYDAGRYADADSAFAAIGRSATYNRGLTLAATGDFALSVAYFDAVLFADRYDADAQHNRRVVLGLVDPVIGEARGHGRIETILSEAGIETAAFDPDDPSQPIQAAERDPARASLKRPVTGDRTAAADDSWLDTLADAPGEYLKGRLAAEMDRRRATGEAHREEADRW